MASKFAAMNAALITQTTTAITGMRVTAVRPCAVYFRVDGYGIDPTGNKIDFNIWRGRSGGTAGTAIVLAALDSRDATLGASVATALDAFSSESGVTGGTKIDSFSMHQQYHALTEVYTLNTGDTLDIEGDVYTSGSVAIRIRAIIRDLV